MSNDDIKDAIKLDNNALGSSDTVVYDKSAKVATITFETLFAADSQHTLSFEGMTASDGSIIGEAEALSFKIMPAITASITTPGSTTDVATSTQIVVELSSEASWCEASNIVVSTDSEGQSPVNCSSDISGKIYTFTPDNPLNYNKTYYVTVKKTTDTTTGVSVEKNTFSFITVANIVTAQISSKSYTGEGSSALYYPKAVFALTFSQSVDLSNDAIKAAIKLDNNALGSSDTVAYDSSAKVATITFDTLFATDSEHGLSFEGMTAGDGSTVEAVSAFSFKIMPAITASLTTPDSTTGVATNTAIVVKLSSAVGESLYSVDNITIKDSDNNIVGLSSTKTVNGAEYTVTPASPLNWLATYTVTVAQDPMTCIPTATQTFTFCTTHNPDFAGGNGTEENPYLIANATHLNNVRKYNYGNNFKQIAHVDLSSFDNWTSISSFSGKYDGDGYKIENLKSSDNGLMDYVTNATFKNINLSVNITKANKNIGGLAATTQNTTIEGCHITGTLNLTISESAGQNAGFFVGWAKDNSTIKNCYCDGTIESNSTSSGYIGRIGGICGNLLFSPVEIINCYSNVSISHTGESGTGVTGCLVGANQVSNGSVTNCFSKNSPILGSGSSQNSYSSADGYDSSKLNWDSSVWNIPTSGSPKLPTLKCMRE